jgi:hypothetical protein
MNTWAISSMIDGILIDLLVHHRSEVEIIEHIERHFTPTPLISKWSMWECNNNWLD